MNKTDIDRALQAAIEGSEAIQRHFASTPDREYKPIDLAALVSINAALLEIVERLKRIELYIAAQAGRTGNRTVKCERRKIDAPQS